jgi:hypothetical protein
MAGEDVRALSLLLSEIRRPRVVHVSRLLEVQSMKGSMRVMTCLVVVMLAALGQSCSGTPSVDTSQTEVTVTGVVKVKGKTAAGGEISFNPSDYLRKVPAFTAPISQDGSYTMKTYPGENLVTFGGDLAKAYPALGVTKKFCIVARGGHQEDFDLLGDEESAEASAKTKMMSKAAAKGKSGRRSGGK